MARHKQGMCLHYAVNPLVIGRRKPVYLSFTAQNRPNPVIAVAGLQFDLRLDLHQQFIFRQSFAPSLGLGERCLAAFGNVRAGNVQGVANRLHFEPLSGQAGVGQVPVGYESECNRCFLTLALFKRLFQNLGFQCLFAKQPLQFTHLIDQRSIFRGRNDLFLGPRCCQCTWAANLRHKNSWFGAMPCRRSTRLTVMSGS